MRRYKQLDYLKRSQTNRLWQAGLGLWQELQNYVDERHKEKPKHVKFTKEVETFVREKLEQTGVRNKLVIC